MASAVCPYCNEPAFSSVEFRRPWTCPTCHKLVIPNMNETGHKASGIAKDPVIDQYSRYWVAD